MHNSFTLRIQQRLSNLHREDSQAVQEATQDIIAIFANPQCTLTSLSLSSNNIGDAGAIALAEALKDPRCMLTSLNLRWNNIGSKGAQALAEALQTNSTLTSLNLSGNHISISSEGVQALADALKINKTLTSLNLLNNHIDDQGAIALAEALKTNSTLTSLCLFGNDIGPEGAIALAEALKDPRCTLTSLDLTGNNIRPDTQTILFEAVLAWAQKGRLIEINGVFSEDQTQAIQKAYDAAILASYQRLALATASRIAKTHSSPITFLSPDLLQSIAEAHAHRSITPSKEVLDRFITHPLPSAADEKQAATMSLAKQCLFNISLGLAVSAFTAHMLDLTFDTATLLSPPFAMSLAVGIFVTTLAFFATSSYITVCRPNTPTESSSTETQSGALISTDPAPTETSSPEAQDINTPDEHRLHR